MTTNEKATPPSPGGGSLSALAVPIIALPKPLVNRCTGEIISTTVGPTLGSSKSHKSTAFQVTWAPTGRLLQLCGSLERPQFDVEHPRGVITEMSPQSRKRVMQLLGSIDVDAVEHRCLMLTTTYPKDAPTDPLTWHYHEKLMLQKLERRLPYAGILWRLELQQRGAPHFHHLIVPCAFVPKEETDEMWTEIAHTASEYEGKYACRVDNVVHWREACAYVSKYVAKLSQDAVDESIGRRWGVRREEKMPRSIRSLSLTTSQFRRLKAVLLCMRPPETVPDYLRYQDIGCWSMLDGSAASALVEWAVSCDEPAESYLARMRK